MVKLPPHVSPETPGIDQFQQLNHDYGAILILWGTLEISIEITIARLTGMSFLNASIVLGSLQFGAKRNILSSLLRERGDTERMKPLTNLITFAKRNALVHSVMANESDHSRFDFHQREIKDAYKVTAHSFTADTFHDHFLKFIQLEALVNAALGISKNDLTQYAHEAKFSDIDH